MRCSLKSFASGCAVVATLSTGVDHAQSAHLLGYQFNDAQGSAVAVPDGSVAGTAPALNIFGPAVIGASGSGVSGVPSDRALDNSAAASMGGTINSSGGRGTHATDFDAIDGLTSFTIAGWFKTASTSPIGGNAVLVANRSGVSGFSVHGDPNVPGNLVLAVDNNSNSSAGFGATGEWVNFAVTYDGTALQPGPNVFFYAGGINASLALVGSGTNTNGSGNDPVDNEAAALSFGARVLFGTTDADPFDGLLDNFRIWDSVIPLSTLEPLRLSDIAAVPEPASLALATLAGCAVILIRRER
ncbi:LamG-like jellyroll fold domain-containing protein [Lacipirellula sp.]|uniref:LamG-like jellyroll fold domain-containing protein n=1 Tax=Lacipirellula sp. TaxID=2691419 RepID=UPI003D131858